MPTDEERAREVLSEIDENLVVQEKPGSVAEAFQRQALSIVLALIREVRAETIELVRDNATVRDGCSDGCCGPEIDWDDVYAAVAAAERAGRVK